MAPGALTNEVDDERSICNGFNGRTVADIPDFVAKFAPYRNLVPLVSQSNNVYLNSAYITPSNLIVHEALMRFSYEALHDPNPKPSWQSEVEDVRELVAKYINTEPSCIAFTRNTTEALGNFIRSVRFQPGDNVVLLDTEHPNVSYGWMALRQAGLEVRRVPTAVAAEKTGKVVPANADTFAPFVDARTRAIALSSFMFHSGQRNDVAGICAAFRSRGIHVLVDLTQHVGFAAVDVKAWGISAAAFSLHKGLNCPTGLACMYVDTDVIKELDPVPPIIGFGSVSNNNTYSLVPQDRIKFHPNARRYEHVNLSFIGAVTAKAFLSFYLDFLGPRDVEQYLYFLGDLLRRECAELGLRIMGSPKREGHSPHLYILELPDPAWGPYLEGHGIYVTSYPLGLRVSLGFYNNVVDIKRLTEVLRTGMAEGLIAT
ncbi:pyridoxal phosphate-dependent transferase [Xylariales sp. PMI_506]|nr:pyridoxal phosphate-dependent transferase [Xylariales sp. PMI_506]